MDSNLAQCGGAMMKSIVLFAVLLLMFLSNSVGKPADNHTVIKLMEESSGQKNETQDSRTNSTTEYTTEGSKENQTDFKPNRTLHSRMRVLQDIETTSTVRPTEFDYWWFYTTPRRPLFSYRDFPGKPGVATWKEISPAVVKESKKKSNEPTAGSIYSSSTCWYGSPLIAVLCAVFVRQTYLHSCS